MKKKSQIKNIGKKYLGKKVFVGVKVVSTSLFSNKNGNGKTKKEKKNLTFNRETWCAKIALQFDWLL